MLFNDVTVKELLAKDPSGRQLFIHCFNLIMDPSTTLPFSAELNQDLHTLFNAISDLPDATRGILPTQSGLRVNVMGQNFSWTVGVGDQVATQPQRELCSQKSTEIAKIGCMYGRGLINPNDNGDGYMPSWLEESGIRATGDLNTFNRLIENKPQTPDYAAPKLFVIQAKKLLESKVQTGSEGAQQPYEKTISLLKNTM